MKRILIGISGALIWLAGLGLVALAMTSETLETNFAVIEAVVGVGLLLYGLLWLSMEHARRMRELHYARVEKALLSIAKGKQ